MSSKHCEVLKGEVRFLSKILSKDSYCMDPTEMPPVQALTDHKPKSEGTQTKLLGSLLPTTLHKHSQTILLPAVHWKHTRLWSPMTRCEKGQRTIKPSIPGRQWVTWTNQNQEVHCGAWSSAKKVGCHQLWIKNTNCFRNEPFSLWKFLAIKWEVSERVWVYLNYTSALVVYIDNNSVTCV